MSESGGSSNGGSSAGGASAGGGAATGGAGSGGCDTTTGTWAIDFKTNVSWAGTLVLVAGSGSQELKMLSHRTASGTTVTDAAQICSVTIPPFPILGGIDQIKIVFPAAAFGGPPINTTLTTTVSGSGAGATFTSADSAVLVGGNLAKPLTDPWPCFGTTAGCGQTYPGAPTNVTVSAFSVDADGDSKPGVTATATPPGGSCSNCTLVPTSAGPTADELYLAFITIASASGTMDSCTHGSGPLDLKSINQSILGCHNSDNSGDCDQAQVQYVNDNSPDWVPATGGTITMVKLADGATCADVATAAF